VFCSAAHGDSEGLDANMEVDDACILYCERFMEFLIDLLSQLPTRRYVIVSLHLHSQCAHFYGLVHIIFFGWKKLKYFLIGRRPDIEKDPSDLKLL